MEFTGERFVPTEQGQIRIEHYHRYMLVQNIIENKDVLDLACGEGYGAYLLSAKAKSVIGFDISEESIAHAKSKYKNKSLRYSQGNAVKLDLDDRCIDVVVSFETIEHLYEQEEMIAEIKRVLRSDGVLIISSPNRPVYSQESTYHNEFHLKELDFAEFDTLLRTQFDAVNYYGQRIQIGSIIQGLDGIQKHLTPWHDDGDHLQSGLGKLESPVYFLAVCGSDDSLLPLLDPSFVYPTHLDLLNQYVGYAKWAYSVQNDLLVRDNLINKLQSELEERNKWAHALDCEVNENRKLVEQLQSELAERGEWALSLDRSLTERDAVIQQLKSDLAEKSLWVQSLQDELSVGSKLVEQLQSELAERGEWALSLDRSLTERDESILRLEQEKYQRIQKIEELPRLVTEKDAEIMELTDEVVRRGDWGLSLDKEIEFLINNLHQMRTSNSWIVTWPLRESRRWVTLPISQVKRYTRFCLRLSKRIYQSLPLSYKTKNYHRQLIANNFPKLLLLSGSHESTLPVKMPTLLNEFKNNDIEDVFALANQIQIPSSANPLVSVVIPIYGQLQYTLRCLESIMNNTPNVEFEVIVVDDCSPDNSFEVLKNVRGINLKKNKKNKGFIQTCNYGAKVAKGEYLYFLNNDTQVLPEWMDALVRTFKDFPGTGLAGSKLVYPDGRLQEAGGIIWQDGSAWNFGRLQDPLLPVYNYAREVDYCSGASIMVPQRIFNKFGGFDKHYLPAYCEDSDLALKIRKAGYRVIYQPMSTVIHFEGITSGTDTSGGVKAYQIENSKKLFKRWQNHLSTYQANGVDVDQAKDRSSQRRVLVLDHCTPTPNQDAGSVTVFNLLLLLREMNFQVTFVPEDNFLYMPEYTTALQRVGIEVLYAPYHRNLEEHLKQAGERYDLAFLFRPVVAERHLENVRKYCPKSKVLYHTVDLHFLRMAREADLQADKQKQKAADEMQKRELAVINSVDASIVHSTAELELLQPMVPNARLHVYPLVMEVSGTKKTFKQRSDVVFVGGYQHAPNVDAVNFFASEVMPLLRKQLPGVNFYAVGSKPPAEIQALATDDIKITGFVEELGPFLDKMRVSVAPLRYGAGIKGKIGTSMAAGLPVVATSLAAEGMSLTDGENILVADDADDFAKAVVKIYQNEPMWNRISSNGIRFADRAWGAQAACEILASILIKFGFEIKNENKKINLYSNSKNN